MEKKILKRHNGRCFNPPPSVCTSLAMMYLIASIVMSVLAWFSFQRFGEILLSDAIKLKIKSRARIAITGSCVPYVSKVVKNV